MVLCLPVHLAPRYAPRMALVLAVSSLKGGVGKTTITINLACALHRAGHRALIVDADSQGSCVRWAARAAEAGHEGPPVVALAGASLRRDLSAVSSSFDVVVIDSPPRLGAEARAAMLAADLVLLPTTPGAADIWALRETLAVLEDARGLRPELRAAAILNRADRSTLSRMTAEALSGLGVPVLDATLGARVAVGEATLAGLGVVTYAPGSAAAREVEALTASVLGAVAGEEGSGADGSKEERAEDRGREGKRGQGQAAGGRLRAERPRADAPQTSATNAAGRGASRAVHPGEPAEPRPGKPAVRAAKASSSGAPREGRSTKKASPAGKRGK